jgi:transposase
MDRKIISRRKRNLFSDSERHSIIQEYLNSESTKDVIWRKYTGKTDHGHLLRWMRELGYSDKGSYVSKKQTFAVMAKHKPTQTGNDNDFEMLQLKKRIAELEKQVKDAEMKAIAFSTMVDIAEEEFKIPIRKKFNTKP